MVYTRGRWAVKILFPQKTRTTAMSPAERAAETATLSAPPGNGRLAWALSIVRRPLQFWYDIFRKHKPACQVVNNTLLTLN